MVLGKVTFIESPENIGEFHVSITCNDELMTQIVSLIIKMAYASSY